MLQQSYQAGYNATSARATIVEPANMPSGSVRGPAALVPFDASTMVNTDLNANGMASYISAATPVIVEMLRATSAPLMDLSPAITSCTDYVAKKYFDYSRFENAAHACGTNLECVYQAARTMIAPPTLYSLVAPNHPATPIFPQIRPPASVIPHVYRPKNGFFEVPPSQIFVFSKYKNDPNTAAIQTAIQSIPTTIDSGDRWDWHRAMHDRNAAEGLVDDDYLEQAQRMDAYRLKEAKLVALKAMVPLNQQQGVSDGCGNVLYIPGSEDFVPPSIGGGGIGGGGSVGGGTIPCTPPPPSAIQQMINDLQDSMADDLLAEWHHVRNGVEDHGCVDPNSVRCDWSPRRFANEYVGRLQSQQEAAYGACTNATGNQMPGDPAKRADWISLEGYFAEALAQMTEDAKKLPWKEVNGVPSTNTLRIQGPKDHRKMGLPSVLEGEYDYDLWWELTGKTVPKPGGPKLCAVNTELSANLKATFTAPQNRERFDLELNPTGIRINTHTVVDGDLDVSINRNNLLFAATGHLVLFDQIVQDRFHESSGLGGTHTLAAAQAQRSEKLYEYEDATDVFGIPVYVYIHIDGTAGFQYTVTAVPPPADACAANGVIDEHNLAGELTAVLTPYGNIHAGASAGVGVRGILSVGVQADLDVVTARLPITSTLAVAQAAGNPTNPAVEINFDAHLDAELMAGAISLYAEALFERVDKEIVHWRGIKWTEDAHARFSIPLLLFNTQFDKK